MEKGPDKYQWKLRRILVTGPESTGKTELAIRLADRFKGVAVEEYARTYVENLDHPYDYEDVVHIAEQQLSAYKTEYPEAEWVFFDTWLMITKVWFEEVFNRVPHWLDEGIRTAQFDLVLLCAPDIPWIPDTVRENGGEDREKLFERYRQELVEYDLEWELITGNGENRFLLAEQIINRKLDYGRI